MIVHALRLTPGQDLKKELANFAKIKGIQAGCILSSVGSLSQLTLRLSNLKEIVKKIDKFEILSLNGTISENGVHVHLAVSDKEGSCFGGHLSDGNIIHTTCELIMAELTQYSFSREVDSETGFRELKIKDK